MNRAIVVGAIVFAAIVGIVFLILVEVIPPKDVTVTSIIETFVRISLYAREHNKLPPSLTVIPVRAGYANKTTDAWHRPLRYEVSSDGVIRLTSLGKDGKHGGGGDDADISRAYYSIRTDGSLWVTSEMWIVEAEVKEDIVTNTNQ